MKHIHFLSTLALLALPLVASAQPDPNNAPKGNNPVNRPVRGGRIQNMTPEQLKTFMGARIKTQLAQTNVTDEKQQDAVVTYILGEMDSRQKLMDATNALQTGIRNAETTDAQVAGLLNDYRAAADDDKARHQKALDTLKVAVDVTQFPRLEAMLTLAGLLGDAPAGGNMMGGAMMGMIGGFGGGGRAQNGLAAGGMMGGGLGGARGNMANRRNQPAPF